MANKLEEAIKTAYKNIKNTPSIESKSENEIYEEIKKVICKSANISEKQWNEISSNKELNINLEDMSIDETNLKKSIHKLAHIIQHKESVSKESKNKSPKEKLTFKVYFDNSLKNEIVNMTKPEGVEVVKQHIITQATEQGIPLELLEKPQSKLTNELTLEQLTFPPDTKFIDGITHVMYENIMGRNAFEKEYEDPYKKPHYTEKSGVNKIIDDYILGKNDTHITTKDNESTYQPSM